MFTTQSSQASHALGDSCLPGGYIDHSGKVHKQFSLRALIGRDEEFLARASLNSALQSRALLLRCLTSLGDMEAPGETVIDTLLVGDCEYLILALRQLSFGDRVEAVLNCPSGECKSGIDVDFNISDIPITTTEVKPSHQLLIESALLKKYQTDLQKTEVGSEIITALLEAPFIEFRLPIIADQIALAEKCPGSDAEITSFILHRCITKLGTLEAPNQEEIACLPSQLRLSLEKEMESLAPNLELSMDILCPSCGLEFEIPFELQDFFFSEVQVNGDILRREIHYLAFHYHWSEEEIMSMPREKRQVYVANLSEEIERMNDAVE